MLFGFGRGRDRQAVDVSVVIPVYNHERYVGEAIESALRQTAPPREIVCIDDGSTDGSARVVEELARGEPTIRFWSRPNQGANHTLNEGIRAARGSYVAILNSDDVFHPSRLERCVRKLEVDPAASAVATGISFIDGAGASVANPWYEDACAFHRGSGDLGLALVNANFIMTTSNLVARRAVFERSASSTTCATRTTWTSSCGSSRAAGRRQFFAPGSSATGSTARTRSPRRTPA
jgi:glycosyltransferase involved in cell wall biosynthesis